MNSGGARGAGVIAGAPGHVWKARAAARVRQQERRAARAGAHAGRRRYVLHWPGYIQYLRHAVTLSHRVCFCSVGARAHRGEAVAYLRVVRAVGRRAGGRRGVARAPAARRAPPGLALLAVKAKKTFIQKNVYHCRQS